MIDRVYLVGARATSENGDEPVGEPAAEFSQYFPGVCLLVVGRTHVSNMTDEVLVCADCGTEFPFSASEKQFYAERGFSTPKRCKPCRAAVKARLGTGGGGGNGAPRGERTMYATTCNQCGVDTEVPFKPTGSRPVLCSDCFRASR